MRGLLQRSDVEWTGVAVRARRVGIDDETAAVGSGFRCRGSRVLNNWAGDLTVEGDRRARRCLGLIGDDGVGGREGPEPEGESARAAAGAR